MSSAPSLTPPSHRSHSCCPRPHPVAPPPPTPRIPLEPCSSGSPAVSKPVSTTTRATLHRGVTTIYPPIPHLPNPQPLLSHPTRPPPWRFDSRLMMGRAPKLVPTGFDTRQPPLTSTLPIATPHHTHPRNRSQLLEEGVRRVHQAPLPSRLHPPRTARSPFEAANCRSARRSQLAICGARRAQAAAPAPGARPPRPADWSYLGRVESGLPRHSDAVMVPYGSGGRRVHRGLGLAGLGGCGRRLGWGWLVGQVVALEPV